MEQSDIYQITELDQQEQLTHPQYISFHKNTNKTNDINQTIKFQNIDQNINSIKELFQKIIKSNLFSEIKTEAKDIENQIKEKLRESQISEYDKIKDCVQNEKSINRETVTKVSNMLQLSQNIQNHIETQQQQSNNMLQLYDHMLLQPLLRLQKDLNLLDEFSIDRKNMTYQQLAKKYSISESSVYRIINQIKSQNSSPEQSVNQSQISESFQQEESQETQNSEQEEIEETQISEQSITEKSADESQEELNNSLIDYLNEKPKINDSVEIQRVKKEKVQIQKPVIQHQKQEIQPIQTVEIQNQSSDDSQEIQNFMVKIRKMIQYFNKEQSIFHIIGNTDFQQKQFITNLYKKNLEQIQLIHKTIQFELMFSRSNDFIQNSIETVAAFAEKLLLVAGIDVTGCFEEMKQDPEFDFYFKMMLCDNAYIANAKQIIFMKFIKNYYQKYQQNKLNFTKQNKPNLDEKVNAEILEKFNKL
ncbi:hypothetical protein ABPG74_003056 [Tetrahymena malaccensis]